MCVYYIRFMCLICQLVFLEDGGSQYFQTEKVSSLRARLCDSYLAWFSRYSGGGNYFYKLTIFQALCQALNKRDLI